MNRNSLFQWVFGFGLALQWRSRHAQEIKSLPQTKSAFWKIRPQKVRRLKMQAGKLFSQPHHLTPFTDKKAINSVAG